MFNKILKDKNKKEENMSKSEHGSSNEGLDYKKVQDRLQSCGRHNAKRNDFQSLEGILGNFRSSFEKLTQEDKNEELKSDKFETLSSDINNLKFNDAKILNEVKDMIKKMELQKELSQDEKIDQIYNKVHTLSDERDEQGKEIAVIGTSTDGLKKSIEDIKTDIAKIPKEKTNLDLNPIENRISNLENSLNKIEQTHNSKSKNIIDKIDNIKFPEFPKPSKIPTDYLKEDDFKFELNNKFDELKDLKELAENLETVPAKVNSIEKEIKDLSEKMDNLPSLNSSKNIDNIPKEEKAVIDLAKYMNDGVAQFENIAKEYVSKIHELEKFEKTKINHQKELEKVKEDATNEGKKEGQISLIKEIAERFPSSFDKIKSSFEEYITEQFIKNEEIEITNENQNDILSYLDGEISLGKYKIVTPAILLDDKIIIKAKIEAIKENKVIKKQEEENQDG